MILAARSVPSALAALCFAGVVGFGGAAHAEDGGAPAAAASGGGCDVGHARDGKGCMAQIARAGACASPRQGTIASGGGGGGSGGDCGDGAIGSVSARFTPASVGFGPDSGALAFNPPAPGPPPGPDLQPGEIGGGGGGGPPGGGGGVGPPPPPPAPPVVTVIESPAHVDPLPGLLK